MRNTQSQGSSAWRKGHAEGEVGVLTEKRFNGEISISCTTIIILAKRWKITRLGLC